MGATLASGDMGWGGGWEGKAQAQETGSHPVFQGAAAAQRIYDISLSKA